ncbi:SusC/RagA family TonB-linked outer membrane protein [Pedobacter cryoconitis]|uniref:TonB-linked SusC/RagA family outer membrane protein n=1 Tax=Pedobacter cryoconitis TaxID=188932 RepID=A0A327T293_9SPHI|nr:SusC/RagA family TonB-linked outer membrane protein [Pedobacter cryoconitis]RAJ31887.1 TonB-linked SusC/RagA family outer membrane protein [Pedobacter cryoconitis]
MIKNLLLILFLIGLSLSGYSQKQTTISGQVLDPEGLPIPGASVYVDKSTIGEQTNVTGVIQNTAIGTVTNSEGKFTLTVPEGTPAIRVSYMGYSSVLVNIINKTKLTISMASNDNNLGEVVVNGYTTISKRKNTTATTVLDYDKVRQSGVSGIDQMLEGQIAGVAVTSLGGGPSGAPKIRIRGTVSLNGGQDPLWVLDGIPLEGTNLPNTLTDKDDIDQLRNLPIAGLNPDDIADITILKDAAATSIYGARAANGVIVITTKKGKKGPVSINFSANTFISERPNLDKLNLMNSTEKVDFELGLAARPDLVYRSSQGEVARILNRNNELENYQTNGFSGLSSATQQAINALRGNNTDWNKELYQTAINQQYSLSFSGGNDQANYYFSGGYYDEKGTTIGTGLKRYNMTLKTDFNLSQKLKVGVSIFASKSDRKNYLADVDGFTNPARYSRNVNPYQQVNNADGSYSYDRDIFGTSNLVNDIYVPFNIIEERNNTRYTLGNKSVKSIIDMDYQIFKDLKLHSELGLQFEETAMEKYAGQESYFNRKFKQGTSYYNSKTKQYEFFLPEGGIIQNQQTSFFQYNWKTLLEYKKVINEKHEIEALAGTEFRKNNNEDILTKGFGFNERTLTNQNILFPNSERINDDIYRAYRKTKLSNAYASFYGTLSYTYNRRYTAYGSVRYDGSDLFGVDPKYRYLPIYSISGAWNANEEDFIKKIKAISNLRFRTSYGIQGNIDKNTSPQIVGRYSNTNILPGSSEGTINVESPPNGKLRWEKTTTFNAGVDLGLFNNAFQITFDYYNRNSKDLIGLQSLPLENGFEFTNSNFAQVKNKGLELTISTRNISTKGFQWWTDFNIAHNKSKVTREMAKANQFTPSREGYPVNALFVLKTAGLDANGIPQFLQDGKVVSLENFYKLYDPYAEFDPGYATSTALTNKEYQGLYTYAGDRDPKYTGGLVNRFRFGNIDLAISAIFNLSQMVSVTPSYNPAAVDRGMNFNKDILNAWTPTNTNTDQPQIIDNETGDGSRWMAFNWYNRGDPANSYRSLDIFAKKVSYLRLNSIRLGYTLPAKISSKVKANSLRFSVEGRNMFVLSTGYKGYSDPETYGNIYAQPISRSISIGLNATF